MEDKETRFMYGAICQERGKKFGTKILPQIFYGSLNWWKISAYPESIKNYLMWVKTDRVFLSLDV